MTADRPASLAEDADGGRADELTGTVRAVLPRALYRVALESGHEVVAHAPSGPGRNFVRLIEGDRVVVALAARDAGRARIVRQVRRTAPGHR